MTKWTALTAALLLTAGIPSAIAQQGAADPAASDPAAASMDEDQARMGDRDDDADWGLLGLLGLGGLLGMKRRNRDDVTLGRRDATAR
ncbi:MAG TPA: WGxxGxxG family protein [Steroidobacteraceae bacterium]|nr:WGxxGxxG family protein [Steroidobacteraceae bacterium]